MSDLDSARAEKPLKPGKLALAFQHEPDDGTFGSKLASSHRPGT